MTFLTPGSTGELDTALSDTGEHLPIISTAGVYNVTVRLCKLISMDQAQMPEKPG